MRKIIINALQQLANNNRVFCSEAEFQFALSQKIQSLLPNAVIVLEKAIAVYNGAYNINYYVDIVIKDNNQYHYIELKYQTSECNAKDAFGGTMVLKNQAAEDLMRYDYLKDILRLYDIAINHPARFGGGFAILLSNDKLMYKAPPIYRNTLDYQFRIHDRRGVIKDPYPIPGKVTWKSMRSDHWTKKGERSLVFTLPTISTNWDTYLQFVDINGKNQDFKYLINEVGFNCATLARRIDSADTNDNT